MKRYKPEIVDYDLYDMVEDPNGEWVKHEEAQKEIGAAFQMGVMESRVGPYHGPRERECNCLEYVRPMFASDSDLHSHSACWICPAHGYKRR